MSVIAASTLAELLLLRSGLVFVESSVSTAQGLTPAQTDLGYRERLLVGFDLELAQLGYVASVRLRERLKDALPEELVMLRERVATANAKATGGSRKLEPLFRRFPEGIPDDTFALWWDRVVVHFLQAPDQPCVLCRKSGTIHALNPCAHLVCEACFDGANYSGCPICNRKVDLSSPFFRPPPPRGAGAPPDKQRFALLDLGNWSPERTQKDACRELFVSLCERAQPLSPVDLDALRLMLAELREVVAEWIPEKIPVRENIAHIFGALLRDAMGKSASKDSLIAKAFAAARPHLTTATDVLRLIVAISGGDVSLAMQHKPMRGDGPDARKRFGVVNHSYRTIQTSRFAVAKLPRALRRELLAVLESFREDLLVEDLARHASRWVWLGEHLHPGEYAKRFPKVARAFDGLRNGLREGAVRPWPSAVAHALDNHHIAEALALLMQRPGELLRRLDKLLRSTREPHAVLNAFVSVLPRTATPALLTLRAHLAVRAAPAAARVFWPKSGYHVPNDARDSRPPLPADVLAEATASFDEELLRRFAEKPRVSVAVLDDELAAITAPFCERTASKGAVQLPRGSKLPLPASKHLRLFMHWCEPEGKGMRTDLDLSIGFFDEAWSLRGTCAYYSLTAVDANGYAIAKSSGDFTSAPWPSGAAEFVDFDREAARKAGYRYAVMVVNAFSGLPFHGLARASAGVMLRDSVKGDSFDPTTVELAFSLGGEHGIFLPLLVDLETSTLHWLDVYSKGNLAFNNVASSQGDIARVCPAMLAYFASRTRPTMLELGRLHAAARAQRVLVRRRDAHGAPSVAELVRGADESPLAFLQRLRDGRDAQAVSDVVSALGAAPVLALLHRGDLALPESSSVYAVFRRKLIPTLAAADLLS